MSVVGFAKAPSHTKPSIVIARAGHYVRDDHDTGHGTQSDSSTSMMMIIFIIIIMLLLYYRPGLHLPSSGYWYEAAHWDFKKQPSSIDPRSFGWAASHPNVVSLGPQWPMLVS